MTAACMTVSCRKQESRRVPLHSLCMRHECEVGDGKTLGDVERQLLSAGLCLRAPGTCAEKSTCCSCYYNLSLCVCLSFQANGKEMDFSIKCAPAKHYMTERETMRPSSRFILRFYSFAASPHDPFFVPLLMAKACTTNVIAIHETLLLHQATGCRTCCECHQRLPIAWLHWRLLYHTTRS